MQNKSLKIISLVAMVIMLAFYFLSTLGYLGDNPVGRMGSFNVPLIVPQPYAFAIWGVIYTGLIVFPIYQWFFRKDENIQWNNVRMWYAVNVVLNGCWLAAASYNWLLISLIIIVMMLFSLYKINGQLIDLNRIGDIKNYWTEKFVFSLYFAWITLATVLNVSAVLAFYNWDRMGFSEEFWTLCMLPIAAIITGLTTWKYKDIAYASVVIWAFVALVVKHAGLFNNIAFLSACVILIFFVLIFLIKRKTSTIS